jgi:phospholipase/carboxylesterase
MSNSRRRISRRLCLLQLIGGAAAIGCGGGPAPPLGPSPVPATAVPPPTSTTPPAGSAGNPRLTARPQPASSALAPGSHALGLGGARDGLLYVPNGYSADRPIPLIVVLHGLGGHRGELNKIEVMPVVPDVANAFGVAFLFPESRAVAPSGWDRSNGSFGPDIAFLDSALTQTFTRLNVSPGRIGVWGFSDGASYSLSMGLCNGDLFSHVAAFSPEYMSPPQPVGQPKVFVSHGRSDPFIPIAGSRDGIVPELRTRGYSVDYVEFDGPHTIDAAARTRAMSGFLS